MKLSILLGALLLSATPAFADEILYLSCSGTSENELWQWKIDKWLPIDNKDFDHIYKINFKEKLLFLSSEPEVAHQFETVGNRILGWYEPLKDQDGNDGGGADSTHIEYDPPGKISGSSMYTDSEQFLHYMSDYVGICEASDASAYEASIRRFTLSLPARKWF